MKIILEFDPQETKALLNACNNLSAESFCKKAIFQAIVDRQLKSK